MVDILKKVCYVELVPIGNIRGKDDLFNLMNYFGDDGQRRQ